MCDMIKGIIYIIWHCKKVSDFSFIKGSDVMLELTPNLNTQSKIALYVQLYEYIKKEIKDGTIPAFTKLPAKKKTGDLFTSE